MIDDDLKGTGRSSPFAMLSGGGGPVFPEKYHRAIAAGMKPPWSACNAYERGERVNRFGARVMVGDPSLEKGARYKCPSSRRSRSRCSAFIPARLRAAFGLAPDITDGEG